MGADFYRPRIVVSYHTTLEGARMPVIKVGLVVLAVVLVLILAFAFSWGSGPGGNGTSGEGAVLAGLACLFILPVLGPVLLYLFVFGGLVELTRKDKD
jgi:hypothetical protein